MKWIIDNILLIILIFYIADASTITESKVIYPILYVLVVILFFLRKNKINKFIFIIIMIWLIINVLSFFVNDGLNFSVVTLVSLIMKTTLPFFIVKTIGLSFFNKFLKYVYVLTIISLVFYFIDLTNIGLFDSISGYLNLITKEEQTYKGGWYIFVYMHSAWAYMKGALDFYRNCGFMWEPGGFAMLLIPILAYRLSINNFRIDKYVLVFVIAIITTFSTSGILALLIISIAYVIYNGKKSLIFSLLFMPALIYISIYTYQLDFMSGKIDEYQEGIDKASEYVGNYKKVNRFAIMQYSLEQAIYYPLGNGVSDSKYLLDKYETLFSGANTHARILYKWGFLGLFLMLLYSYKFYKMNGASSIVAFLFMISFSLVLFSNPGDNRPLLYIYIYYFLIYRTQTNLVSKENKLS